MRKVNRLCQNRNFPTKNSGFYEKTAVLSEISFFWKRHKKHRKIGAFCFSFGIFCLFGVFCADFVHVELS